MRGVGTAACVELLLKARATVDAVSKNGETPLTLACYWKHKPCVALLIKAGANLHVGLHWSSGTVLDWAKGEARRMKMWSPVLARETVAPLVLCGWLCAVRWSPQQHFQYPRNARGRAVKLLFDRDGPTSQSS